MKISLNSGASTFMLLALPLLHLCVAAPISHSNASGLGEPSQNDSPGTPPALDDRSPDQLDRRLNRINPMEDDNVSDAIKAGMHS